MIFARIGERLYEFETTSNIIKARSIYARFAGSQDDFENTLSKNKIPFKINSENSNPD